MLISPLHSHDLGHHWHFGRGVRHHDPLALRHQHQRRSERRSVTRQLQYFAGELKKAVFSGGIYYIISRSLGPEFGASVGIVFAFANAVAASMNTIGFCDSLNDLLKSKGLQIVDGGVNDVRIVGMSALVIMIVICAVGMEWEVKV
jgi:Amino acid permease